MRHDGVGNDCESDVNFIMAAYGDLQSVDTFQNLFLFTRCSLTYLNDTVNRLDG